MTLEDTLNAEKTLDVVAVEVRDIVHGKAITSYNVGFDLGRFLYHEPWDIRMLTARRYDIMYLATRHVMVRARADTLEDKDYLARLLMKEERSYYPGKWVRSDDAYRSLCPDNPMGLGNRQTPGRWTMR